jgi:XTP/dITP diphosphohydrolase
MTQPIAMSRPATTISRKKLVLATSNQGKIDELRQILGSDWQILGMNEFNAIAADETGSTFEENAILKSEAVASQTGLPSLADDSGLVVDALGGAPGVYSARFAGPEANDAANRELLLKEMESFGTGFRDCRFVCAIALSVPGQPTVTVRGTCEGTIGHQEIGNNGFGYDSLFVLADGRTMAQLEPEEKNAISHRGVAMQRIIPILRQALNGEESS